MECFPSASSPATSSLAAADQPGEVAMTKGPENIVSDVSKNFGIIIAFLLPGFIALWPIQYLSATVATWLSGSGLTGSAGAQSPTTGSFLMVVLASLALGMLISAIRWLLFDTLLHRTLKSPSLDWSKLQEKLAAFDYINENHYRYYQYYANSAVAVLFWCVVYVIRVSQSAADRLVPIAVTLAVAGILERAAWDSRKKNIQKVKELIGKEPEQESPPAAGDEGR